MKWILTNYKPLSTTILTVTAIIIFVIWYWQWSEHDNNSAKFWYWAMIVEWIFVSSAITVVIYNVWNNYLNTKQKSK